MATLLGTLENDTLIGTPEDDFALGNSGNDNLLGLEANDQLNGNTGNDTANGGVGNDLVRGGKDNDLLLGDVGNDSLYGDLGNDTARGGNGDDFLYGDSGIESNFSGDGDDFLFGEAGNDTLFGLDGNDSLLGDTGADVINGNQGNDTVYGGDGSDLLRGGIDNDRIFAELGDDSLYGDLGDDTLFGAEGKDAIFGGRGEDLLSGNEDDDEINGNQGNDTVFGGQGNDILRGGRDDDIISGDVGDDLIYGDRGIDTLTGGDGKDIFFLQKGIGGESLVQADIITDFVNGEDAIGLIAGFQVSDLNIFQGTGANTNDTIIQDNLTGQFLAVLKGVNRSAIDSADFSIPGVFTFTAPTFQVNEDGTPIQAVTVTRTDGLNAAASVTVTSSNGTATAPADYNNTPVVVNFAAGETSKTVTIPIVNDAVGEYTESINLNLTNPTGGTEVGLQNSAVLQIVDNDSVSVPKLTFDIPDSSTFRFGISIEPLNNSVLIQSSGDSSLPGANGAAYKFDVTTGALLQSFFRPDDANFFDMSIGTVGNNVLIGAPRSFGSAAAYLFDGDTGTLLKSFVNPSSNRNLLFGSSVEALGNNILIAAPDDDREAPDDGAVYLFDGNTGALLQTFLDPTPDNFDWFGYSLAAVGNNVLIGAPFGNTAGANAAAAYLFDSTTGALLQTFLNPTPGEHDSFGISVAAAGNNVLIGAPGTPAAGAAYLFDSTTGALLQTFLNPTLDVFEGFGSPIVAVGNNVLIGAPFHNTSVENSGAAYLFDGSTGALLQTYLNPKPESEGYGYSQGDFFGSSLAAVGNNIIIGAPSDNEAAGAVYLF